MPWYVTLIIFLLVFSLLVLIHEWGHFFAARRFGIKVEEFGIGFPPKLFKLFKDKKGTIYTINALPLGGFVRLYGENAFDKRVLKSDQAFAHKKIWQRITVVVAGVLMNFILAWALISIGFMVGMKPFLVDQADVQWAQEQGFFEGYGLYLTQVSDNSPLAELDLSEFSVITQINGNQVTADNTFLSEIKPSEPIELKIENAQTQKSELFTVIPSSEGRLGISLSHQPLMSTLQTVQYPVYQAPWEGLKETGRLSWATIKLFGQVVGGIVTRLEVSDGVGGPVAIFQETGRAVERGWVDLLQFTALISISLGVINVMPIPALDGGRLLFLLIEGVIGKRLNPKHEAIIHLIGFAFLLGLILLVTWNDIWRLIGVDFTEFIANLFSRR